MRQLRTHNNNSKYVTEMTFKGHSRSSEMSRIDRAHTISYYCSIVTILYRFPHNSQILIEKSRNLYTPLV